MSEHEKRLREWLATFCGRDASAQALADLDALLAEHRAEVEAVKAERDADRERYAEALSEQMAETATARDAALEEAAERVEQSARRPDDFDIAAGIRALKSQSAERYLRESEVRTALLSYYSGANVCSRRDLLDGVATRLGVDLDAERRKAPHDAIVATDGTTATVLDVPPGFRVDTRQTCARCGNLRSEHDVAGRIQIGEVDTVCAGFRAVSP